MEMMPSRTTPLTLRWQRSISSRPNDRVTVLPLTAMSIILTLPKNPCGTSLLFISCLILPRPVSNTSRTCLSSMRSSSQRKTQHADGSQLYAINQELQSVVGTLERNDIQKRQIMFRRWNAHRSILAQCRHVREGRMVVIQEPRAHSLIEASGPCIWRRPRRAHHAQIVHHIAAA